MRFVAGNDYNWKVIILIEAQLSQLMTGLFNSNVREASLPESPPKQVLRATDQSSKWGEGNLNA